LVLTWLNELIRYPRILDEAGTFDPAPPADFDAVAFHSRHYR
jgi:hypothetical protein